MLWNKKAEFKIVITRNEYNLRHVMRICKVKKLEKITNILNKSFTVDWTNPTYINGMIRYYFVDYETGNQLITNNNMALMKPEELDLIVGNHILSELTRGVIDNQKDKLIWIGIGVICGGLIGYIVSQSIMQSKIDEIYANKTIIPLGNISQIGGLLWKILKIR